MRLKDFLERVAIVTDEFAEGKQIKLADMLGVNQSVVANWKSKQNYPSAEVLMRLQEKLGVNISWLLTGKGPKMVSSAGKDEPHYSREALEMARLYDEASEDTKRAVKNVLRFQERELPMVAEPRSRYGKRK